MGLIRIDQMNNEIKFIVGVFHYNYNFTIWRCNHPMEYARRERKLKRRKQTSTSMIRLKP